MFNSFKLRATPANARRLLDIAVLRNIDFDPKLADLALDDLLSLDDFADFPLVIDNTDLSSLQFITDWKRGIVLTPSWEKNISIALAKVWRNYGQTLIMTNYKRIDAWQEAIEKIWPHASVSCSQLNKKSILSDTNEMDPTCDFLIVSLPFDNLIDIGSLKSLKHVIIEDPDVRNLNVSLIESIMRELPSTLVVQNVYRLPTGRTTFSENLVYHDKPFVSQMFSVVKMIWGGAPPLASYPTDKEFDYLNNNGYKHLDPLGIFTIMGVSSHMIKHLVGENQIVIDEGHGSPSNIFTLEAITGKPHTQTITDTLEGNRCSLDALEHLRTYSWGTRKMGFLGSKLPSFTCASSKIVIVCDNNHLIRGARLVFSDTVAAYQSLTFTQRSTFCDVYFPTSPTWKNINKVIITSDTIFDEPKLLEAANYLVIPDPTILTKSLYDKLVQECKASSTTIIFMSENGMFDKKYLKKLLENK